MKPLFKTRSLSRIGISLLSIASIFISIQLITHPRASAQSITGINAEISSLRTRINRLEGEIARLRQSRRSDLSRPNKLQAEPRSRSGNPPIVAGEAIGPSDPLYERLATLLIELKEDVRNIDRRLTEVERKVSE
ncbi:hypothetical protein [Myxosarcina sp. GI1(2024)]